MRFTHKLEIFEIELERAFCFFSQRLPIKTTHCRDQSERAWKIAREFQSQLG